MANEPPEASEEEDDWSDLAWQHDARLARATVDWLKRELVMDAWLFLDQDHDSPAWQLLRITVDGLVYFAPEPPGFSEPTDNCYDPTPVTGLWMDGFDPCEPPPSAFPATPPGCTTWRTFIHDWNRCIYVCGRSMTMEGIGTPTPGDAHPETQKRRRPVRNAGVVGR